MPAKPPVPRASSLSRSEAMMLMRLLAVPAPVRVSRSLRGALGLTGVFYFRIVIRQTLYELGRRDSHISGLCLPFVLPRRGQRVGVKRGQERCVKGAAE